MSPKTERCACGSGDEHAACCGRFHAGAEPATATELMRSRYAAYVRGDARYLFRTLHPDHDDKPLGERALAARMNRSARYRGLHVLDHDGPDPSGVHRVLFHASISVGGKDASFVELSSFAHDGVGLRYVAGVALDPAQALARAREKRGATVHIEDLRIADVD